MNDKKISYAQMFMEAEHRLLSGLTLIHINSQKQPAEKQGEWIRQSISDLRESVDEYKRNYGKQLDEKSARIKKMSDEVVQSISSYCIVTTVEQKVERI